MSTPNVVGSATLLMHYYAQRFPGEAMRASTLKGLLIHTADDLGNPGPDYFYGWGLVNTEAAAHLIRDQAEADGFAPMTEARLAPGDNVHSYPFVWNGVDPIRATLCWTDPAGSSTTAHDSRDPRLVNDLNLTLHGPGGALHRPYVMPYVGNWSPALLSAPAITGVNHTDNVEQVYLAAPTPGVYTLVVNHAGALTNNEQSYSLLVTGGGSSATSPSRRWAASRPSVPAAAPSPPRKRPTRSPTPAANRWRGQSGQTRPGSRQVPPRATSRWADRPW